MVQQQRELLADLQNQIEASEENCSEFGQDENHFQRSRGKEAPGSMAARFYRGGSSLQPRPGEVRIDPVTGLPRTTHGISVFDRPDNLDHFGGAYEVMTAPDNLRSIQRGRDPHHFEIVPAAPMSLAEYEVALQQIVFVAV